jgi:hypothetical protein
MAGCLWKREEVSDHAGAAARPFHVYDHEGSHLGSFAAWEKAHDWAHLQVALTSLPAPLEVEDRRLGTRRRVWADHCEPSSTPSGPATAFVEPAPVTGRAASDAEGRLARPESGGRGDMSTATTRTVPTQERPPNLHTPPHPRRPG